MRDKLPFLPDDHHYAIAHVATRAAQLDHTIEYCIDIQFSPRGETSKFLIKNMDTNRLVSLLHVVLLENFPEKTGTINAMMGDIITARKERNEILHWLWGKGEDDTLARHGSMRPHREETSKTKTAEQIYEVAGLMLDASIALTRLNENWIKKLYVSDRAVPSSDTPAPPTPPERSASTSGPDQPKTGGLLDHLLQPSPKKSEEPPPHD